MRSRLPKACCASSMDAARTNAAARVHTVWLELGALAHVEPDALRLLLRRGDTRQRRGRREARDREDPRCGMVHAMRRAGRARATGRCVSACGSYQLQVVAGDEMRVKEIGIA